MAIAAHTLDRAKLCADNPPMDGIAPHDADFGEGRWTVSEAIDLNVPAPIITLSLKERLRSGDAESFAERLLAAMRNGSAVILLGRRSVMQLRW